MQLIKVGAGVLNQTPLAWESNKQHIIAAVEQARAQGVSLLCLPELCITGYGCEDAFHSPGVHRMAQQVLLEILPETRGMVVSLGLPLPFQNAIYNTACLVADGQILGFVAKQFLAGSGIHYEPRWFKRWPAGMRGETMVGGTEYPLGDLFFEVGGVRIGFEICEDAWVAKRPGSELALRGVDVIFNPSASHFAFGKIEIRRRFVAEGSRAFSVSYIYSNLVGNESGRAIYDGGALIASGGRMLATGPRFTFADAHVTSAAIDIEQTRMEQGRTVSHQPTFDEEHEPIHGAMPFPSAEPEPLVSELGAWESSAELKCEEFGRAISLGLYDYLRKSRSRGFIVSMSGGADSAAVSCLVGMAVELGIADIGREAWLANLGYIPGLGEAHDNSELIRRLLTCVYQSTRNSSDTTRHAASTLAHALGAQFYEFDVDQLVQGYTETVSQALGRTLSWETDDIALQNIQARARAPSVWMLANIQGALLVSTSNRSEAAVGYATMDGDTSGGLSPIAGIDKAFLRQWLRWRQNQGPAECGPLPALEAVTVQAPTAELRPPDATQTDEADLMPYPLLDAIERAAIRDKQTPIDTYRLMRVEFPQYTAGQLLEWIERFFRLWCRNQWKRERYAPSFHVDDANLDPKTWCRFPILSGGYERELAELREYVQKHG